MQRIKDINKISGDSYKDKEAVCEGINKRKFYFMVFQKKAKNIREISNAQLNGFRFLDVEINAQLSVAEIGRRERADDQVLNLREAAPIETVRVDNLEMVGLGNRFAPGKIISSQQIRDRLADVFRFQNLIYGALINEATDQADAQFGRLQELLDNKYKIIMRAGDDDLKDMEYYEIAEINGFHDYLVELLRKSYGLGEKVNFLEVLEYVFNFSKINRDFISEKEADIITRARDIWSQDKIDENKHALESTAGLARSIVKTRDSFNALEEELIVVLNKWGVPEDTVCDDVSGKEFWPLIYQTKAWTALQHILNSYRFADKNVYISRMSLIEQRILDKAFSISEKMPSHFMEMPRETAANLLLETGDFILSVFDLDDQGDAGLLDKDLEDARKILKKKGRLVIVLPNNGKIINQCKESLTGYGFYIRSDFTGNNFYLIDADKGGKGGDALVRLRAMRESKDISPEDIAFLNDLWKGIFEKHSFDLTDGLKENIQRFMCVLPEDFHFKIMISQMIKVYFERIKSGEKFIDLSRLEQALIELNKSNEWGFQLYDKPEAAADDSAEGLLFHDNEGVRINLVTFFQEQSLSIRLSKLVAEIEQVAISDEGTAPGYDIRCRRILSAFSLAQAEDVGIIEYLEDIDNLFKQMGMNDTDPQKIIEAIEGVLAGLFSCDEEKLDGLWQEAEEYILGKDRQLKTIIFKIGFEKNKYANDWERAKKINARFANLELEVMESPERDYLSVQMRILFNLNQWMDRVKNDKEYTFLISGEINTVFNLIYKNTGSMPIVQNLLTLPWNPARYFYKQFFWRGLSVREENTETFKSLLAEIFNYSDSIFKYHYMHWIMAVKYSEPQDREEYLKVLGRIIGYVKKQMHIKSNLNDIEKALKPYQHTIASLGYEVSVASNSTWLKNKVRISDKLIKVVFNSAEQKIIKEAQNEPFLMEDIDLFLPESVRAILAMVVKNGTECPEYTLTRQSAFLRRESLPGLILEQQSGSISTKSIARRLFLWISGPVNSMFEYALILNAVNGNGKKDKNGQEGKYDLLLSDRLMSLVRPGEDFVRFLEAVCNYPAFVINITEKRPEIFDEILKLINSEDVYESTIALKFIDRYCEFKGDFIKTKVLENVWKTILTGGNLIPRASLKVKIGTFATIFNLNKNVSIRNAVFELYADMKSKYSSAQVKVFDRFLKDIFAQLGIPMEDYNSDSTPLEKIDRIQKFLVIESSI